MTQIAPQYAQALYELARDENLSEQLLSQLRVLSEAFDREPDFLRLLASPNVSKQERCALLDDSFRQKLHPYLVNFLKLLTREGIIRHFPDCCKHFERSYYEDNGILPVLAYTAQPLREDQSRRLTERIEEITGKRVILENRVDPACLGGIRLCYDGKQIDGTLQSRLENMGKLLKNTVL